MLDPLVTDELVRAVPPRAHLLVGGVDQLLPVGAGEVLCDRLAEGAPIPHLRLTWVSCQAGRPEQQLRVALPGRGVPAVRCLSNRPRQPGRHL